MEINEVRAIVNHSDTKKYRVSMIGGKTRIVRLWLQSDGYDSYVCIIGKGKRRYGHRLSSYSWDDLNEWSSIKLVEHKQSDKVRLVKRRVFLSKI